ncbi:MAG: hypothetical protein ACOZNI_29390 [Myxococcota bacterium]
MTAALLFLVGLAAGVLVWLGLGALPRRIRALDAIRALAEARGARVVGTGAGEPVRVVGSVGARAFTLLYEAHWLHGDVLLLAVDCASSAAGPHTHGDLVAEASDEALAVRMLQPPADVWGRLDRVLDALVELASDLERDRPGEPGEP